jgi:hypothetical protein
VRALDCGKKKGQPKPPLKGDLKEADYCDAQIFQITPVPGIWTKGP